MTGWLRRMLNRFTVPSRAPLAPLPSSRAELARTQQHHNETLRKADAALRDFKAFDGAFRVVAEKK